MNRFIVLISLVTVVLFARPAISQQTDAEKKQTKAQQQLIETSNALSATTKKGGAGWEKYQEFLHEDFNRWSAGQEVWDRTRTVDSIKKWWEDGNRQSKALGENLSVQIVGRTGVIRKKVLEAYIDKDGKDTGEFEGFVTQVWVLEKDWKLLAATIQRAQNEK